MEARLRRRIVWALVVGVAAAITATVTPAAAVAASRGPIHPGVQTFTGGGQCTANFIFRDAAGTYVGQAAHCSGTGAATATNGCTAGSLPLGTPVKVTGADKPGRLVYSSWLAMQAAKETDPNACAFNDFALVKLDPADVGKVDPTVPGFGGPTGVGGAAVGAPALSYGNSSLRVGIAQLRPMQGLVVQIAGAGWSRTVVTVTPGVPGDSGSGFLNARGQAIGVLSTLALAPLPLSNGVGDLARALSYMRAHSAFAGVELVNGATPFRASALRAIVGELTARSDRSAAPPGTPHGVAPSISTTTKSTGGHRSRRSHRCRRSQARHRLSTGRRPTSRHRTRRASNGAARKSGCARRAAKASPGAS